MNQIPQSLETTPKCFIFALKTEESYWAGVWHRFEFHKISSSCSVKNKSKRYAVEDGGPLKTRISKLGIYGSMYSLSPAFLFNLGLKISFYIFKCLKKK